MVAELFFAFGAKKSESVQPDPKGLALPLLIFLVNFKSDFPLSII
jgi:hypothetical protein